MLTYKYQPKVFDRKARSQYRGEVWVDLHWTSVDGEASQDVRQGGRILGTEWGRHAYGVEDDHYSIFGIPAPPSEVDDIAACPNHADQTLRGIRHL